MKAHEITRTKNSVRAASCNLVDRARPAASRSSASIGLNEFTIGASRLLAEICPVGVN